MAVAESHGRPIALYVNAAEKGETTLRPWTVKGAYRCAGSFEPASFPEWNYRLSIHSGESDFTLEGFAIILAVGVVVH
jgi:hypothetical protein